MIRLQDRQKSVVIVDIKGNIVGNKRTIHF